MTEISREYAAALFMLACEQNQKKEYAEALLKVKQVFCEEPTYPIFLASPNIAVSERLSAISQAFCGQIPENVVSFLQLLCEKGRIACFDESVEEYQKLLDASERIVNARVTSVVALTDGQKKLLTQKLEALCEREVKTDYFIDESLLGGMLVELDGKVLDGSLRSRLRDMKEVIGK